MILQKVTNVLPDINRLLEHYQETQGQLSAKDLMVKQSELMRTEEITRLRLELDAKTEEYDKLLERLVGENYKYKLEIEEKNASIAALKAATTTNSGSREELEVWQVKCSEAIAAADSARLAKEDILTQKLKLESRHSAAREQHKRDLDGLRTEHKHDLESKDRDHSRAAAEHKAVLSKVQMELASLITKHSSVKKDLEASQSRAQALEQEIHTTAKSREAALVAHQTELKSKAEETEELQRQHRQQLESQLESLTSSRQRDIQSLQEGHDQKLKDLMAEHESNARSVAERHDSEKMTIHKELEEQRSAFRSLQEEHRHIDTKHTELSGALLSWKRRQDEWQAENDKFSQLLHTLKQTAGSKPDAS